MICLTVEGKYKLFVEKSKRFFEDAVNNYEKQYYDLSMFSLHQSLELLLRALLIKNAREFPHSHNLKNLMETLSEMKNSECTTIIKSYLKKYGLELSIITDGYVTSRYLESSYDGSDIQKLINVVKEMKEGMQDVC
ncbi:MAG: hypothetical protein AMDU4_FER2C00003G0068 [Ferroplasma sp. Type II]|nr:MAG: hypothetical protein AMDU4_FER2C00003G0068 [Ferroplasma sp. Type II]